MDVESTNVVYSQRHLLFREVALMAQPFDPTARARRRRVSGVAEQIQTFGSPPYGFFSASDAGVLGAQTGTAAGGAQVTRLDRAGKSLSHGDRSDRLRRPPRSPFGRKAAAVSPRRFPTQ